MGVMKGMEFPQDGPVYLAKGDVVLIGTDGVRECQDVEGNFFGTDRLMGIIRENSEKNAKEIVNAVVEAVQMFVAPEMPKDDATLIVVKVL